MNEPPLAAGEAAGAVERLVHQVVALRVGQHDVHAEAGHQRDDALRHRERLAVAGRVGPASSRASCPRSASSPPKRCRQVQQVGQALRRMVEVATAG